MANSAEDRLQHFNRYSLIAAVMHLLIVAAIANPWGSWTEFGRSRFAFRWDASARIATGPLSGLSGPPRHLSKSFD